MEWMRENERIDINVEKHALLRYQPLHNTQNTQQAFIKAAVRHAHRNSHTVWMWECVNQMSARIGTNKNLFGNRTEHITQQNKCHRLSIYHTHNMFLRLPLRTRSMLCCCCCCCCFQSKNTGACIICPKNYETTLCVCVRVCYVLLLFFWFACVVLCWLMLCWSVCDLQMTWEFFFGGISILTFRRSASIIYINAFHVSAYRCVCTNPKLYNVLLL